MCVQELGLPVGAHIPMLGFIGRLDYQKGVDLIRDNHSWMMGEGVQLVLLGSGRADLEQDLRWVDPSGPQCYPVLPCVTQCYFVLPSVTP